MRRVAVALLVCGLISPALAGDNDLVLSRLGQRNATGTDVIPNNQDFRSLASELGVVLAPKFLSPADSLGYSGFQFSAELSYTTINNDARYWCATEESAGCANGQEKDTSMIPTIAIMVRKGIWLPLPSFELGAGALHVQGSQMWAGQVFGKFSVHEGYHDWPVPSVAVRGAASRLFGSEQIDLTVASLDVSVSKLFGVQGTVALEPYLGGNYLWIVPRSEVIDKTPNIDAVTMGSDFTSNFVFPDQDNITRLRFFGGVKVKYYVFALTAEVSTALAGGSEDDRATNVPCDSASADEQANCDAEDKAGSQQTYSVSLSLDF